MLFFVTKNPPEVIHLLPEDNRLRALIGRQFTVNSKSPVYAFIVTAMQDEAYSKGTPVNVHMFSYSDPGKKTIYVSLLDNKRMVRLTGDLETEDLEIVPNGTDGVFFEDRPEWEPWEPELEIITNGYDEIEEIAIPEGYVQKHLIDPINFVATEHLTLEDTRWLYKKWIQCSMLDLTEKMLLLLTGPPGGGKSLAGELLKKALFGHRSLVDDINKEDAFEAAVAGSSLVALDNLDESLTKWLINKLCVTATGASFVKRELYVTNHSVSFDARAWMMLTSTDSKFIDNRRTLADRTLVLRVGRIPDDKFRERETFHASVRKHRNKILTELCFDINQLVSAWRQEKETPRSALRLASVGVAMKRFSAHDEQEQADAVFLKLKGEQKKIVLDNHPVVLAVQEYFSRFRIDEAWATTAADLAKFAYEAGISKFGASGMGRKVAEIKPFLKAEYRMTEEEPRGGSTIYTFRRPEGEDKSRCVADASPAPNNLETKAVVDAVGTVS
jgi:hypothetical protein